eukprot:s33_g51.t1
MALWFVGTVGLRLCWTVFYDDFTLICKKRLSNCTSIAAEALFDLFGMWYAKEGSKAVEFSDKVKTLGLLVQLGNIRSGFCIGHTDDRREELRLAFLDGLEKKTMEPKQAERLRGRMQWFEGYAFGRIAQHSLKILGDIATRKQRVVKLSALELTAIEFLLERISKATAFRVNSTSLETYLIFTDGACEGDGNRAGSVGGVLVSPDGKLVEHFSSEVPEDFMRPALQASENPIYELELALEDKKPDKQPAASSSPQAPVPMALTGENDVEDKKPDEQLPAFPHSPTIGAPISEDVALAIDDGAEGQALMTQPDRTTHGSEKSVNSSSSSSASSSSSTSSPARKLYHSRANLREAQKILKDILPIVCGACEDCADSLKYVQELLGNAM